MIMDSPLTYGQKVTFPISFDEKYLDKVLCDVWDFGSNSTSSIPISCIVSIRASDTNFATREYVLPERFELSTPILKVLYSRPD